MFVLNQVLYPAAVSVLHYREIDAFINRQLRKITGMEKTCSITMLRNELGVLECKFEAQKRALNYLWHLLNETSFKDEIAELTGPGPYMRLVNLAQDVGIDPAKAQTVTKGEWKGVVDRAIRSKACKEKTKEAESKGVPPPRPQFLPRNYIKLGGGAAKYGVQFRWNLYKKAYDDLKEGIRIGLPADSDIDEDEEVQCENCEQVHSHRSTSIQELMSCYKACDTVKVRKERRRALRTIAQEVHRKHYQRVPKWTINSLMSLDWENQSRDCTVQALLLMKALLKECKQNASIRSRVLRVRAVSHNVLQDLLRPC